MKKFQLDIVDATIDLDDEREVSGMLMVELRSVDEYDDDFILKAYRSAKGLGNKVKLLKWLDENEDIYKEDVLEKIKTLYD